VTLEQRHELLLHPWAAGQILRHGVDAGGRAGSNDQTLRRNRESVGS
jgi:hypothetical protein